MTAQELKNSVLRRAFRGELVERRDEEGTGAELLRQIEAEKASLTKAGKLKKEKPLPTITEEEKPFEIPEHWTWTRLGKAIVLLSGTDFKPDEYNDQQKGVPYITGASSLASNGVIINRWTEIPKVIANQGDILLVCKGSGYGKTVICNVDTAHIARQIMAIKYSSNICMSYLRFFLLANFSLIKTKGQGIIPGIDRGNILNLPLPLPPLAEQARIVAKLEEIWPEIERYAAARDELEALNRRFPNDLRKAVLQSAIRGELVERRAEEGTGAELLRQIEAEKASLTKAGKLKKEKPLPTITDEEKPFEIPEHWTWTRLGIVLDVRDGTHSTPKYTLEGVPLVTSKNLIDGRIDFTTAKLISAKDAQNINMRSAVNNGDILFAMIGTIGNPVWVKKEKDFCIKNMALFKAINPCFFNMQYLLFFLQCEQYIMKKKASGGVQAFVSLKFLRNYLIPLPPLAEQARIVAKLEEILPLCDRLR